jgi:hypothetical protein
MVGDINCLKQHITTLRVGNPDKVFVIYKGCIIRLSEEYAKANYTTREFKTNVATFINNEGIKRTQNGSLTDADYDIIINSNIDEMNIMK